MNSTPKRSMSRRADSASVASVAGFAALTEKAWQSQVLDLAKLFGWRYYHTFDSRRSVAGFPDLALFRPGRFLLVELKAEKGKLSPSQENMIADLRAARVEVHVFRPSDFDAAVEVLR